jgi:hypothetical protein
MPKYNDDGTLKELAMTKRQLVMEWTMDLWRVSHRYLRNLRAVVSQETF